jgi:nitrite reductase/ring-hydroxylating ferredoxin subunit
MKMSDSSSWVFAIEEEELKEDGLNVVYPKGLSILLIKKAGKVYALSNKCAHMGCGMGGGVLREYILQCPCHDWKYDIRTGAFINAAEIKIPVYDLKLSDGKILINVEGGVR